MTTPAAPAVLRPDNYYVDPSELRECLREYRRTGVLCDRLSLMLLQIARGVYSKFKFSPDPEDFASECWIHLAKQSPIKRVDPEKNPFAYFTMCAVRFGWKRRNKWIADFRRAAEYRKWVGEYMKELLSVEDVGEYCSSKIFDRPTDPEEDA